MDEDFIENEFYPFYFQLTVINVRLKLKEKLNKQQEEFLKNIQMIIPIFNRINKNNKVYLEELLKKEMNPTRKIDIVEKEQEEDEIDEEGDKLVEALTINALKQLQDIRQSKWMKVSYELDEDSSDEETESAQDQTATGDEGKVESSGKVEGNGQVGGAERIEDQERIDGQERIEGETLREKVNDITLRSEIVAN